MFLADTAVLLTQHKPPPTPLGTVVYEGGPQSFPVVTIVTPGVSNAQAHISQRVKTIDTDWGSPPHLLKQGLSLERAFQLD